MKEYKYHENRNAVIGEIVGEDKEGYVVQLYQDGRFVRTVEVLDHSIRYAEEVVENWIMGIINE
jgi:hypothetical protein